MTRAAIYLRVSVDRTGEMLSVDRQREDCLAIVKARGWQVAGEYTDNSISASKRSIVRPGYAALVDDFEAGVFDAIVCWDLDRLTRQPRQLEDWIDAATERGLILVTANGEADLSTDAGRLFARIKAAVAREEIERKGARQKRAAQQRAESGGMASFKPCYGYTSSNMIIPTEAAVVLALFQRFAAGETLYALVQWLNASEHKPKQGERWRFSTLRDMLRNPRYCARVVLRGEVLPTPGTWEPIVPAGLFDTVQAILSDPRRKTNRVGTERRHLLSGVAVCGVCGARVSGRTAAYFCSEGHVTKARALTDEFILEVTRRRLRDLPPMRADVVADPALDARVLELRGRLTTIEEDYDAGLIDGRRYQVATEKVRAEIEDAERRRDRGSGRAATARVMAGDDPVAAFDAAPLSVQRAVIGALMTIRLMKRSAAGGNSFDYNSISIEWRSS